MSDKLDTSIQPKPEFSRRVQALDVPRLGRSYSVTADAAECAALARRFDLLGIDELSGDYSVKTVGPGPLIRVEGVVKASVTQKCIVSLEPVAARVEETVSAEYGPKEAEPDQELSLDDADPPEAFEDGAFDLGELTAQHLSLALDPFPRKTDADVETDGLSEEVTINAPNNPFAALSALKKDD